MFKKGGKKVLTEELAILEKRVLAVGFSKCLKDWALDLFLHRFDMQLPHYNHNPPRLKSDYCSI